MTTIIPAPTYVLARAAWMPTLVLWHVDGRFARLEGEPCDDYAAALAASWRVPPGKGHRLRSNCPSPDALGILPSAITMSSLIAVITTSPIAPVEDLDTLTSLLLVVLAAGGGWFLWRRA